MCMRACCAHTHIQEVGNVRERLEKGRRRGGQAHYNFYFHERTEWLALHQNIWGRS